MLEISSIIEHKEKCLRGLQNRGIKNSEELINNILLAPYSVPFVKLPEFKVTLILSFVDHRYLDEQTDIHKLKLTLTFTFEPYEEYGTSKMKIIAKQIKAAN